MKLWVIASAVLAGMSGAALAAPAEEAAKRFGARQDVADLSLSPDGTKVAYVSPVKGQGAVVYTLPVGAPEESAKVALYASGDPDRLDSCSWISNSRLACEIYGVVADKELPDLLPYSRIVAVDEGGKNIQLLSTRPTGHARGYALNGGRIISWMPEQAGTILMTRTHLPNDETGSRIGSAEGGLGVDLVDTATLSAKAVEQPRDGAIGYISDGQGSVRILGMRTTKATGYDSGTINYSYRTPDSREWQPLGPFNDGQRTGFRPLAVDRAKNVAYGFKDKDGHWALYSVSLDGTKREQLIFARPDVDVSGLITLGRQRRVVGVTYITDVAHQVYFDPDIAKLAEQLSRALPNHPLIRISDASEDESKLLIFAGSDRDPGVYYLFDKKTKQLQTFLVVRPELEGLQLAEVKAVTYPAADGTPIPAYLTLPPGSSGKGLPAIVLPHGGPAARDQWGFDWLSQFYAARGFAVLQPNFRGSAGYGDAWLRENGFKSWKTAISDVTDGGRWLVSQGIADKDRLGIVGWSYGGYAALQAAAVEPGFFKAVVAIAPVTDLASLKEERRNWSDFVLVSNYVGSGPHIREGSPAQNARAIKVPVLLVHGTLDNVVSVQESRLMADRLAAANVPHELVTFDKLDHYLDDSVARTQLLEKSDAFLRKAMGM